MKLKSMLVLALVVLALVVPPVAAQDAETCENYQGVQPAPPFPPDLDWINVDGPLSLEDMAGKVVVLDFWTYGCINCLHMIPVLDRLEEKYPDELVVVSVHSAKFDNEAQTENIREIVQRYEMEHPVINDDQFRVWRLYAANAWPTFVVLDPDGNVFARQAGEIPFVAFDQVVGTLVGCFDERGQIDRDPIPQLDPELDYAPARSLNYPGKVLADPAGNRLFIADSVNHRLVIADLTSYEVLDVIGTGAQGYADGGYDTAQFYKPQGMALRGDTLYVADTFNHTIRAVDLAEQSVMTVAGTGEKGRSIPRAESFPALATDLRSPWDVTFGEDDSTLYIAMAGTHQLWAMDTDLWTLSVVVGNGSEAQLNETLLTSELAQPSGLYFDAPRLYFADSESSTIRVADIEADSVAVVSGTTENSLFTFGDVDGPPGESLLQHALGVSGDGENTLFIADTYNDKIKQITLDGNVTDTLAGAGPGLVDGPLAEARFNEPGGLHYANGHLYVADTNNHAIRVIDLEAATVDTITFPNPQALQIDDQALVIGSNAVGEAQVLAPQTLQAGDGVLAVSFELPEGYKINDLAPSVGVFRVEGDALALPGDERIVIEDTRFEVPLALTTGDGTLYASFDLYYCEAVNETLCFVEQFSVEQPVSVEQAAADTVLDLSREVVPPQGFADDF